MSADHLEPRPSAASAESTLPARLLAADGTVLYKHLSPLTMAIWETEFMPRMQSGSAQQR